MSAGNLIFISADYISSIGDAWVRRVYADTERESAINLNSVIIRSFPNKIGAISFVGFTEPLRPSINDYA